MDNFSWLRLLRSPRFFTLTLLGFSSGLPLALTGSALEARYASSDVSLQTIGFVTLVGLPYSFKFLWAPIMDRYAPGFLGRRRAWMVICQIALIIGLFAMAVVQVEAAPLLLAFIALFVAFCSASQDIAIDAYRADILRPEERGIGMSFFVGAYRAALLFAGSVGLILASSIGWQATYLIMAVSMAIGLFASFNGEQPEQDFSSSDSLKQAFLEPLKEFAQRPFSWAILLFLLMYKFGDAFAAKLMTTFFIRGVGFELIEIGAVNKFGGFFAMLFGIFLGGLLLARIRLFSALLFCGLLQAFSNLMFVWLAAVGKSYPLFVATVMIENFCGGMGSAAFLALIMALCDKRFSAAQYALFSALVALPREILGPISALLSEHYGWMAYYEITFITSFPGLLLLVLLAKHLPEVVVDRKS